MRFIKTKSSTWQSFWINLWAESMWGLAGHFPKKIHYSVAERPLLDCVALGLWQETLSELLKCSYYSGFTKASYHTLRLRGWIWRLGSGVCYLWPSSAFPRALLWECPHLHLGANLERVQRLTPKVQHLWLWNHPLNLHRFSVVGNLTKKIKSIHK